MQSTEENCFHANAGISNKNLRKEQQKQTQITMHSTTAPVNSCHNHHFDYSAPGGNEGYRMQSTEAKCFHANAGICNKNLRKEHQKQTQIVMHSTSQHSTTWWSGLKLVRM